MASIALIFPREVENCRIMKLSELYSSLSAVLSESSGQVTAEMQSGLGALEVTGVTSDTREVKPGSIFVAIRGSKVDGHDWISEARKRGAIFIVGEDEKKLKNDDASLSNLGAWVAVTSGRRALDLLAKRFYGDPSAQLFCVGVTGTNGKTSTTYMLEQIFNAVKLPMGVLGTINHHLLETVWPSSMTTPDPVALQGRLREMLNAGARAVAMEVSSHALDQHRADGVHFNTAVFTNLTRDHLDYHSSMQTYFAAKQRLFSDLLWVTAKPFRWAVINIDDEWGRRLRVPAEIGLWTYGQAVSDYQFKILKVDFGRTDFELKTPYAKFETSIQMCGLHNVYNAVAAIAAATTAMISPVKSAEILAKFTGVPGRMEWVANSQALNVFVDYAHSPDALENVLKALREVRRLADSPAQIWTIFGCGGDRDKGKRPQMAKIAEALSDHVMVTSDNPRTENPQQIIQDIQAGFPEGSQKWQVEVDRRKAIQKVCALARPHDVILVAGKGHEDYQIIGDQKVHFSDVEIVKETLG
jgi:UDP-N-acetylmuramoyl-L-alanyl-D-glutamate--2,6-diaminopimelate ligase